MPPKSVVTHVSSTVRRPGISAAKVRDLVEATLAAERIRNAMISVTFVGKTAIARMNADYLKHKGATDVISFGMGRDATGMPAVGDIPHRSPTWTFDSPAPISDSIPLTKKNQSSSPPLTVLPSSPSIALTKLSP